VDVYVVTPDEYVNFINGRSFQAVDGGTFKDTKNAEGSLYLGAGSYYFVVTPHGVSSSSVTVALHGGPTILQLITIPVFALIISGIAVLIIRRRRKKKRVGEQYPIIDQHGIAGHQ